MTRTPPYRVGVIGIGFGQRVHVPALRMDSRFEVRAICASTEKRARAAANRLGIPRVFGDWRELVADRGIDVVSVAVPPALQPEILKEAIRARKALFVEKPVGGGARRAAALAREAREAGVPAIVDFELETLDVWQEAAELVRGGRLGALRQVTVSWNVETHAHRHGLARSWKLDPGQGGGTLSSFGSHVLRYLEWLFGPVSDLCAWLEPAGADAIDHLWLRTAQGLAIAVVLGSNSRHANLHRLSVYGEKGCLVLENAGTDHVAGFTLRLQADPMTEPTVRRTAFDAAGCGDGRILATAALVKRLGDVLESGAAEGPSLADGARVELLIEAARRSAGAAGWVRTEEPPA